MANATVAQTTTPSRVALEETRRSDAFKRGNLRVEAMTAPSY
jgi:hypothetical protein